MKSTPVSTTNFSEMLQQTYSGTYTSGIVDTIAEYDLPDNANLIPTELSISSRSDGLRDELINFRDSTGRHSSNVEQLVMPVSIDNAHFAGLHIKRNNDGSYAASYIDPLGGEEKTLFEKTTTQISEYIFGKTENSEITAKSYLGPIPRHIVEVLEDVLNINSQDVVVTTNKLQYSMRNGYGIRVASDNNSGPIVTDILTSIAKGNVAVSGTRLTALEGQGSDAFLDISDRSEHSSKMAGEVLRNFHAATLVDIYPDQAAELEAMKLEESPRQKKRNIRGSDKLGLPNNGSQDQIGGGSSAGRILDLVTKAMAFSVILSANSNNQQADVGSSLAVGGRNQNNNGAMIGSGESFNMLSRSLQINEPTSQPSGLPSGLPTALPSEYPSSEPTGQPTQPSSEPSGQPSDWPSVMPSSQPSNRPSVGEIIMPTSRPSGQPSDQPSSEPSGQPSSKPSGQPSDWPSVMPSSQPSNRPSVGEIIMPTVPTRSPSAQPSLRPSGQPSSQPTSNPTSPTSQPTAGEPIDDRLIKGVPDAVTYTGIVLAGAVVVAGVVVAGKDAMKPSPSPSATASDRRKKLNDEINNGGRA